MEPLIFEDFLDHLARPHEADSGRLAGATNVLRLRVLDLHAASNRRAHRQSPKQAKILLRNEGIGQLDVTFGEDKRSIRSLYGAENFALVTRFALSLLKRNAGPPKTNKDKYSVRRKRKNAMWSDSYYLEVLSSGFPEI